MRIRVVAAAILPTIMAAGLAHAVPATIAYQGELRSGGALYVGSASLKAAVVDGGATLWSNDGTSSSGGEPSGAVTVAVVDGIFSIHLGDVAQGMVAFDPAVFGPGVAAPALRVWVDTGGGFEQLPDQPLASSLFALSAESANGAVGNFQVQGQLNLGPSGLHFDDGTVLTTAPVSGGGSLWQENGSSIYRLSGNVGVGTSGPTHTFEVAGDAEFLLGTGVIDVSTPGGWPGFIGYSQNLHRRDVIFDDTGIRLLASGSSSAPPNTDGIIVTEGGDVGIHTVPGAALDVLGLTRTQSLAVSDPTHSTMTANYSNGGVVQIFKATPNPGVTMFGNDGGGGRIELTNNANATTFSVSGQAYASGSQMRLRRADGTIGVEVTAGTSELKCFDSAGALQTWDTGDDGSGNGRVRTDIVEITGGSDPSERFDIGGDLAEPGMVVAIDRRHPGRLVLSDEPYQRTVAGVISGAGGVRTGLVMGQSGSAADGEHAVALTGRVWTWCDADAGPIEPGDLLTTAPTPGHAMRADDHARAQGAVLGKAMSGLETGRGLVLVLVGMQ